MFTKPVIVIASPVVAPELMFELIPTVPVLFKYTAWALVVGCWLYPRIDTRPVELAMFAPANTKTPADAAWLLVWPSMVISPEVEVTRIKSVAAADVPSFTPDV